MLSKGNNEVFIMLMTIIDMKSRSILINTAMKIVLCLSNNQLSSYIHFRFHGITHYMTT